MTETIQDRIQAANKAYYANQMMLKNRYINRGAKMQIYKTHYYYSVNSHLLMF